VAPLALMWYMSAKINNNFKMKKTFTFFFNKQFNMKKLLTLIVLFGIGGQAFALPLDSAKDDI